MGLGLWSDPASANGRAMDCRTFLARLAGLRGKEAKPRNPTLSPQTTAVAGARNTSCLCQNAARDITNA